jgi:hypothetical protein
VIAHVGESVTPSRRAHPPSAPTTVDAQSCPLISSGHQFSGSDAAVGCCGPPRAAAPVDRASISPSLSAGKSTLLHSLSSAKSPRRRLMCWMMPSSVHQGGSDASGASPVTSGREAKAQVPKHLLAAERQKSLIIIRSTAHPTSAFPSPSCRTGRVSVRQVRATSTSLHRVIGGLLTAATRGSAGARELATSARKYFFNTAFSGAVKDLQYYLHSDSISKRPFKRRHQNPVIRVTSAISKSWHK